jgi:hypothetical protein
LAKEAIQKPSGGRLEKSNSFKDGLWPRGPYDKQLFHV